MAGITKGTVVSFGNTPQAKDDVLASLSEDAQGIYVFDVMANDLGGNAKTLWSLDDGNSAGGTSPTDLLQQDIARTEALSSDHSKLGATIWITADGQVAYDASSFSTATQSLLQQLAAGEYATDSFTYAIRLGNGTLSWATATIQIAGANDAPVLANTSVASGGVWEDTAQSVSGQLSATDVDHGDHQHWTVQGAGDGEYGSIKVDANGKWTYELNNEAAVVQALAEGEKHVETFVIRVTDDHGAYVDQDIKVNVTGTNDVAAVSSDSKALTEGDTAAAISTGGTLVISDVDSGEAHVVAQNTVAGTYGKFSIDADGNWTYVADSAHDELRAGQQVTDSFTVTSQDGTGQGTVKVTITGTNDIATVSSDSKALTEGDTAAAISTGGTLVISDADSGEAHVVAQNTVAGTYGKFSVDADGNWTYAADSAHDELRAGQQVTDSFTVTSHDGTGQGTVTVTINGTNDPAVLTPAVINLTATNTALTAGGTLSIIDPDGDAAFIAQSNVVGSGGYGKFAVGTNGDWSYTADAVHNEFKAGTTYTDVLTVTSTDGTQTSITVNIVGTNHAPTSITVDAVPPSSETAAPMTVAQLSASDPDVGDVISFSIQDQSRLSGDAELFAITNGNLLTAASGSLFSTNNSIDSYRVDLRATDQSGAFIDKTIFLTFGTNRNTGDDLAGNNGDDIIYALGNAGNQNQRDIVKAGSGNDRIFGQGDNDTLFGEDGNDVLTGGAGADIFVFDSALNGVSNVDTITDFNASGVDRIYLDRTVFTQLSVASSLASANFVANSNGVAIDANDYILFDTTTGNLYYDADGNGVGAKVQFATLTLAGLNGTLDASDFTVIA